MAKPQDASFAIIIHNNKILLFLRDDSPGIPNPNCWQLPGGGIEAGETPFEALKRELVEEVGYCPKKIDKIGYRERADNVKSYLYFSIVNDEEASQFKHTGDEGMAISFFTIQEMKGIPLVPSIQKGVTYYRPAIEALFKNQATPQAKELGLIPF